HDGSRAMEVQTIFRGIVTGTRVLFNPEGKSTHSQGTSMLYAGIAAVVIALIVFVSTAIAVGQEKMDYERWQNEGREAKNFVWKSRSPAGGPLVFGGIAVGLALSYMGLKRRGKSSPNFIIGSDADADAPVSPEY